MKKVGLIGLVLLAGCAAPPAKNNKTQSNEQKVVQAAQLITNGAPAKAISDYLEPVIKDCEVQRKNTKGKLYSSRSPAETIVYMALASSLGTEATAVSSTCSDAYYFKAYANVDLGRLDEALNIIQQALVWSPMNARIMSEQGHLYQLKKQWGEALDSFTQAEDSATLGPEDSATAELLRAKRGVGFALTELGRLDEAEAKFMECIEIDKADKKALNELEYIKQLRQQPKNPLN
jgi:Flp pilus assembly protein TadD